jgi:hypothetical protein
MTIKQLGGVFGRNPTFNDVTIEGQLTFDGDIDVNSDLKVDGNLEVINDLTVDTNSLYVNSTNNEVCIGQLTSINAGKFNVKGDSAHNGISATPYADTYYNYYGTNTAGGSTFYVRGDGISNFQGAMTVEAQLNNTGNHVITNGNVVVSSGYGIDFSATAGTGTSELFSDYEEGTWTATLFDASSGGNASSTTATGRYTKIGRVVNCIVSNFNNISTSGMSGTLRMSLPFTPSTGGFYSTGTASMNAGTFPANTYMLTVAVYHGEARAYLQAQGTNGFTSLGTTNITSGTTEISQMTFSYIAA